MLFTSLSEPILLCCVACDRTAVVGTHRALAVGGVGLSTTSLVLAAAKKQKVACTRCISWRITSRNSPPPPLTPFQLQLQMAVTMIMMRMIRVVKKENDRMTMVNLQDMNMNLWTHCRKATLKLLLPCSLPHFAPLYVKLPSLPTVLAGLELFAHCVQQYLVTN